MLRFFFLLFAFFCMRVNGQFLAVYSFSDVTNASGNIDPTPTPLVQGVWLRSFRSVGVSANSSAGGRFAFNGWSAGAIDNVDDPAAFTGALSGIQYYEVSLAVMPGYTLQVDEITFGMRRSGTGPRNYSLRGSPENFSADLAASTGTNSRLAVLPNNIFFWKFDSVSISGDQKGSLVKPGAAYANITDSVTFRIYAWNSEASGGSFSIDNFSVLGWAKVNMTGIEDPNINTFSVVNPVSGGILKLRSVSEEVHLRLFSTDGILLREWRTAPAEALDIALPPLQSSIYYLECSGKFLKLFVE